MGKQKRGTHSKARYSITEMTSCHVATGRRISIRCNERVSLVEPRTTDLKVGRGVVVPTDWERGWGWSLADAWAVVAAAQQGDYGWQCTRNSQPEDRFVSPLPTEKWSETSLPWSERCAMYMCVQTLFVVTVNTCFCQLKIFLELKSFVHIGNPLSWCSSSS